MPISKGPWTIRLKMNNSGGVSRQVISDTGGVVCIMKTAGGDKFDNSHLIAAAPELLGALEDVIKYYAEGRDFSTHVTHPIYQARAAIAKAKGE